MAFGKNWLVPINSRLAKAYPGLSENELRSYDLLCQNALKSAHKWVQDTVLNSTQEVDIQDFEMFVLSKYPWVSSKNIGSLFKQGMYYAQKDEKR